MEGPRKTGKEKISRRDFLKGIASIAATTASVAEIGEVHLRIPDFQILKKERDARRRFERFDGLNAQEREKIITREAEEFGAFIRSKEGTRILESGTDEELSALLSNMPAILREHVKGTTYDIDPHHWPSTIVNVGEWKKFVPHIDPTHRDREAVQKSIGDKRFGNGFFIDDETLITNKHVVSAAFPYFRKYLQPYPDSDEKREALAQMETIQSRTDATGVDITTLKAPKVDAETERT
ncbi:twin-arginine translocation signal domain-containing protein, partial [Candidatus Kaiserbacteria bacterium]|nr:twin-arginine translocation signal domain-containing protein [Candidatus Kaiserbacteria bacterium]